MMYWGNGMGTWGMALMAVGNFVLLALVISAVIALVRHLDRRSRPDTADSHRAAPQQLLAERFARGDIDEDEYARRLAVLCPPPHSNPS